MLSKKAQYAIYALLHLARNTEGPVLISDVAQAENLPKKFLELILLELKNQGFVGSKKGKGGGYFLIKKPMEISLVQIIRHFDGAIALLPCVSDKFYQPCSHCRNESACGVKMVFREIRDETVKLLEGRSLADILNRENFSKEF